MEVKIARKKLEMSAYNPQGNKHVWQVKVQVFQWHGQKTLIMEPARSTRIALQKTYLLVVIQNDNHVLVKETSMVHGFIRHSARNSAISNDRNAVILSVLQQQGEI